MTALDDLTASVSVAREALAETRELTEAALDQAYQKIEHAAALGVAGVAATIQAAHHQLQAVASSLLVADGLTEQAGVAIAEITHNMGPMMS